MPEGSPLNINQSISLRLLKNDIHDRVLSRLFAMKLVLERNVEPEGRYISIPVSFLGQLKETERILRNTLRETPSNCLENNTLESLRLLLENYEASFSGDIYYSLIPDKQWQGLNDIKRQILLDITRETFTNIFKHSEATEIKYKLKTNGQQVELIISDNGVGFNKEVVFQGFGLKSMQARIQNEGGEFRIQSFINKGTEITVII